MVKQSKRLLQEKNINRILTDVIMNLALISLQVYAQIYIKAT